MKVSLTISVTILPQAQFNTLSHPNSSRDEI